LEYQSCARHGDPCAIICPCGLVDDLCHPRNPTSMSEAAEIHLRDVTVRAPSGESILAGITLSVAPGESVAFIGRSGAGKTTALRLINGMVTPAAGEVLVNGLSLARTDLIALRRRTGYIIQGSGLFPHRSVFDNVAT